MSDPQTVLRKLISEHADRLYRVAPSGDGMRPFNARIDDEDADALAAALLADERFQIDRDALLEEWRRGEDSAQYALGRIGALLDVPSFGNELGVVRAVRDLKDAT